MAANSESLFNGRRVLLVEHFARELKVMRRQIDS